MKVEESVKWGDNPLVDLRFSPQDKDFLARVGITFRTDMPKWVIAYHKGKYIWSVREVNWVNSEVLDCPVDVPSYNRLRLKAQELVAHLRSLSTEDLYKQLRAGGICCG